MRTFSKREKILFMAGGVVALVALFMAISPMIRQLFSGGALTAKREQLQSAQDRIELAQIMEQIDGWLREHTGLEGQIISDSLVETISKRVNLEDLNRARRRSDLLVLHPALEGKAETLLAYKAQHGPFESLDALKEIRGPIFEGEPPEAVISQRISELAQRSGVQPNYQLNIKAIPGKKSEKLPARAKRNLILFLYLSELDAELQQLQAQQKAVEETVSETESMDAVFDAWWGDDEKTDTDNPPEDTTEAKSDETETTEKSSGGADATAPSQPDEIVKLKSDRQFAPLPEVIPLPLRIQLIQSIQSHLKQEIAGEVESKKGFIADQITIKHVEAQDGFLGLGAQKQITEIQFKPDSILLSEFEKLLNGYADQQPSDTPAGGTEDQQREALAQYLAEVLQREERLQNWLAKVPSTYQPETYIVEMNFNGEIDKMVQLIQSIQSTSKWLLVRDVKISVADKKRTLLSTNLSMIAKVL